MNAKKYIISYIFFALSISALAAQLLDKQKLYPLLNQANESFRQANAAKDPRTQAILYEKSILLYEKIIADGSIKNPRLYYNLANAYLLSDNIGKAILNYRRAENLDSHDQNIKKNLAFARAARRDKVTLKTEKKVLKTLFFWHYDFSIKTKFALTCIFFALLCLALTFKLWFPKLSSLKVPAVIFSIIMLSLLISVVIQHTITQRTLSGVITAQKVVARQGEGEIYPKSFEEPLHAGTEFDILEQRTAWLKIRLADSSIAWIPQNAAESI